METNYIYLMAWFFFIYAFLGWCTEVESHTQMAVMATSMPAETQTSQVPAPKQSIRM